MSEVDAEALLSFEAGIRRRRRIMFVVVVALGVVALGTFVYATRSVKQSMDERGEYGIRVTNVADLSPDERAEVEQQLQDRGYHSMAPGTFACPADMMPIAASQTIPAFCVDTRDATNAEVAACIAAGKCAQPPPEPAFPCEPVQAAPAGEPATCIDYKILDTYCAYVGKRGLSFDELDRSIHLLGGNADVRCAITP